MQKRGQQHSVTRMQAASAAEPRGNGDVGAGVQGHHSARVAARGHHARISGQGQPVAGAPAKRGGDRSVGDPAGGIDAADPVDHILGSLRCRDRAGQRQRPAAGHLGELPTGRDGG
jgi:hypothetical protein